MSKQEGRYDFGDLEKEFFAEAANSIAEKRELEAVKLTALEQKVLRHNESLLGLIELNPDLNELARENMKSAARTLSLDLQSRLKELSMSSFSLAEQASIPHDLIEMLLEGKYLPSLSVLHKATRILNCELQLQLSSVTGGACFSSSILPEDHAQEIEKELGLLLDSLELRLSNDKLSFVVRSRSQQRFSLDYPLSSDLLFRKLAARLYRLELRLLPSLEASLWHSFVY